MKDLLKRKNKLLSKIEQNSNFVRGSLNSVCVKCNRANCICKEKSSRKAYRLTYKNNQQKTRIVYVKKGKILEIKKMIGNYVEIRKILEELLEVNIEIFKNQDSC